MSPVTAVTYSKYMCMEISAYQIYEIHVTANFNFIVTCKTHDLGFD